jgi:quercetin dioxygenase-like cupin family protein
MDQAIKIHLYKLKTTVMKRERINVGQVTVDFLLEAADTNGSVAMFEFTVPAGAKVPVPHAHEHFDETICGLSGVLTFTIDGVATRIGPGDTCYVPKGAVHGFDNLDDSDAKCLAVITPALLGPIYFKEVAEVLHVAGPPDVKKIGMIMVKHGLIPVRPGAGNAQAATTQI